MVRFLLNFGCSELSKLESSFSSKAPGGELKRPWSGWGEPDDVGEPAAITLGLALPGGCRPKGPLGHSGECQGKAAAAA